MHFTDKDGKQVFYEKYVNIDEFPWKYTISGKTYAPQTPNPMTNG